MRDKWVRMDTTWHCCAENEAPTSWNEQKYRQYHEVLQACDNVPAGLSAQKQHIGGMSRSWIEDLNTKLY